MQGLFTLTSSESKATARQRLSRHCPKCSMQRSTGTSLWGAQRRTQFIIEELMNSKMDRKDTLPRQIIKGFLCVLGNDLRTAGDISQGRGPGGGTRSVIDKLGSGDILIKGANALGPVWKCRRAHGGGGCGTMGPILHGP